MSSSDYEVGVSRVAELENVLGEILDFYSRDGINDNLFTDEAQELAELMERAGAVLEDAAGYGDGECE